jgi:hypothetical protein
MSKEALKRAFDAGVLVGKCRVTDESASFEKWWQEQVAAFQNSRPPARRDVYLTFDADVERYMTGGDKYYDQDRPL